MNKLQSYSRLCINEQSPTAARNALESRQIRQLRRTGTDNQLLDWLSSQDDIEYRDRMREGLGL